MNHECVVNTIPTTLPFPLLYRLKRQYGLVDFVETGTWQGDTAILAALCFERVYTVELFPGSFSGAGRLAGYPSVWRMEGHSPDVLRIDILPRLTSPAFFWLDAHWSGLAEATPAKECPVLDELAAIIAAPNHRQHVVVIDDARYFVATPAAPHNPAEWPTVEQITTLAEKGWGQGSLSHIGDQLVIEPKA